jgi:hypothetical protein
MKPGARLVGLAFDRLSVMGWQMTCQPGRFSSDGDGWRQHRHQRRAGGGLCFRVIVTTTRRLARREKVGSPYRVVYAPASAPRGNEPVWVMPYERVSVSNLERTILDGPAQPDLCAGVSQVATQLWMRHDDLDWPIAASRTET